MIPAISKSRQDDYMSQPWASSEPEANMDYRVRVNLKTNK